MYSLVYFIYSFIILSNSSHCTNSKTILFVCHNSPADNVWFMPKILDFLYLWSILNYMTLHECLKYAVLNIPAYITIGMCFSGKATTSEQ